jgi:hypothetical protein
MSQKERKKMKKKHRNQKKKMIKPWKRPRTETGSKQKAACSSLELWAGAQRWGRTSARLPVCALGLLLKIRPHEMPRNRVSLVK